MCMLYKTPRLIRAWLINTKFINKTYIRHGGILLHGHVHVFPVFWIYVMLAINRLC